MEKMCGTCEINDKDDGEVTLLTFRHGILQIIPCENDEEDQSVKLPMKLTLVMKRFVVTSECRFIHISREPKISDPQLTVFGHEQVARLEVSIWLVLTSFDKT